MNERIVKLGGQDYTIRELPARKNAEWRRRFEVEAQPILGLIRTAAEGQELGGAEDLMRIAGEVSKMLFEAPDKLYNLLFAYVPELDSETILDSAYDSELTEAFMGVLRLAFPFGALAGLLPRLTSSANGSSPTTTPTTSTNSL